MGVGAGDYKKPSWCSPDHYKWLHSLANQSTGLSLLTQRPNEVDGTWIVGLTGQNCLQYRGREGAHSMALFNKGAHNVGASNSLGLGGWGDQKAMRCTGVAYSLHKVTGVIPSIWIISSTWKVHHYSMVLNLLHLQLTDTAQGRYRQPVKCAC